MFSLFESVTDNEAYSVHVEKRFEYVWSLKRSLLLSNLTLKSRNFPGFKDKQFWFLRLQEIEDAQGSEDLCFQVQLGLKKRPGINVPAKFTFVLKSGDRVIDNASGCFLFRSDNFISVNHYIKIPSHEKVENFQLHATVYAEVHSTQTLKKEILQLRKMRDLLHSLRKSDCSDIVIKVDGMEIACHRSVLSCSSAYFNVMFKSGLSESNENLVEITDFDYETIKNMIDYLYTFEYPKLSAVSAGKLLEAADKYQIPDLKDVCEACVVSEINASNAMDVLLHAQVHSAEKVKKSAMDFIWNNTSDFTEAVQYEHLLTRPELLRDLLLAKMTLNS